MPTIDESGIKGYRSHGLNGLFAPRGTPFANVTRLIQALNTVCANPEITELIPCAGVEPGLITGSAFTTFMHEDMARVGVAAKSGQPEKRITFLVTLVIFGKRYGNQDCC